MWSGQHLGNTSRIFLFFDGSLSEFDVKLDETRARCNPASPVSIKEVDILRLILPGEAILLLADGPDASLQS